jgi:hypothetical protein
MFSFDEPNGMLHLFQLLGQPSSLSLSVCVCVNYVFSQLAGDHPEKKTTR